MLQTATGERWEGAWRGGVRHGRGVAVSDSGMAAVQAFEVGRLVPAEREPEPEPRAHAAPIRCAVRSIKI